MNTLEIHRLTARERIDNLSEWEANTGCQLWAGGTDRSGYPCITFNQIRTRAHRVSLLDHLGLAHSDLQVLHRCDTPQCVNPEHLRLGTHKQNMKDAAERTVRQKPRPYTRTGVERVKAVRTMHQEGLAKREIARRLNICSATVRRILSMEVKAHPSKSIGGGG